MKRVAGRHGALTAALVMMAGFMSCSGEETTAPRHAAPAYTIAFLSERDGNREIYRIEADGSGETRLTYNDAEDRTFSWSPDGSLLVFVSDRSGFYEIYVMHADGSFQTPLTNTTNFIGEFEAVPVWSPDGSRIVFRSGRTGSEDIYVMNADGSNQTNITNDAADDWDPAWRPDGWISYASEAPGSDYYYIYCGNTDGTVRDVFKVESNRARSPVWSPVGSAIAYLLEEAQPSITVCRVAGTTTTCVDFVHGQVLPAAWSPDGSRLVFVRGGEEAHDIYLLDATGETEKRITVSAPGTEAITPAWSPDGSEIVFSSNRTGDYEIYAMKADGTNVRRLTNSAGADGFPVCARTAN